MSGSDNSAMSAGPEEIVERENFLATMRHELRTPMNHIIGYCEMLMEDAEEMGYAHALPDLEKIHSAGKAMLALVNDFFDPLKGDGARRGLSEIRHDLRTSVNHIVGYTEILLEEGGLDEATTADLSKIHAAANNLLALINDAAQLARADTAAAPVKSATAGVGGGAFKAQAGTQSGELLVVDDNEGNRDMLARRLIRLGYSVTTAENGRQALEAMAAFKPDLVLLDVMMPEMDGHETLQHMKSDSMLQDIPVIMISALDEISSIVRAIEMGADDYLPKPFDPVLLRARVGASLEKKQLRDREQVYRRQIEEYNLHLEDKVQAQVLEISEAQIGTIFALSKLAESRDPETGAHLERIREYCRILAEALATHPDYAALIDETYVENLYAASPLHDIGKVGVPDHILQKPGRLDAEEFSIMKTHTVLGAETLRAVDGRHPGNEFIRLGIEIAESHHEKWDGSGYPHGLSCSDIPLSGRILALADVYDALRSRRCYKEPFSHQKTRAIILEGRGAHFDPDIVDYFIQTEEQFQTVWSQLAEE